MSTYSRIFLHIVFGTKHRAVLNPDSVRERLYAFLEGIVRDEKVVNYIATQQDHHTTRTYREELVELLVAHGVRV